ncbi:MAG: response regulator [Nitrospinota bacterium]
MVRILIVDDEKDFTDGLETFLTTIGCKTKTALSGEEGLEKVKSFRPQLVLLDVRMPGLGGLNVLPQMKKLDPNLRIIIVTAVNDVEIAQLAVERGADDYITKPVDLSYLENSILVQTSTVGDSP